MNCMYILYPTRDAIQYRHLVALLVLYNIFVAQIVDALNHSPFQDGRGSLPKP